MDFPSRYLTATEGKLGELTCLASIVSWAVRRMRRYTTFASNTRVVLPSAADCAAVLDVECNLRLRGAIVDL